MAFVRIAGWRRLGPAAALLLAACAGPGPGEYADVARAGATYTEALDPVLVAVAQTRLDASGEAALAEARSPLGQRQARLRRTAAYEATDPLDAEGCPATDVPSAEPNSPAARRLRDCVDRRYVDSLSLLRQHNQQLQGYFAAVLALATTDAPARAQTAATTALAAAGTVAAQLGAAVPAELAAAGPLAEGAARALARNALRAELEGRAPLIRWHLALHDRLLRTAEREVALNRPAAMQARYQRQVGMPWWNGEAGQSGDAWIADRNAAFLAPRRPAEVAAARQALASLTAAFAALVGGGDLQAQASQALIDANDALDIAERLAAPAP
jgi:hypothetical protein